MQWRHSGDDKTILTILNPVQNSKKPVRLGMDQMMTMSEIAKKLEREGVSCVCDFDNWQPEEDCGHSIVCPIRQQALPIFYRQLPVRLGGLHDG